MRNTPTGSWQAENRKNTMKLGFWTLAWLGGTALLTFGPKLVWNYSTLPTIAAILINLSLGLCMILAIARYLKAWMNWEEKFFSTLRQSHWALPSLVAAAMKYWRM